MNFQNILLSKTPANMITDSPMTDAERLEMGLDLIQKLDRPLDSDLRILIFTATYFVLDGVTLTIRRLEAHMRSKGATVRIVSTVPDGLDAEQLRNVIVVPGIAIPFAHAGGYSFGVGLEEATIAAIEDYNPNCVHFTVPDFVGLVRLFLCYARETLHTSTHFALID